MAMLTSLNLFNRYWPVVTALPSGSKANGGLGEVRTAIGSGPRFQCTRNGVLFLDITFSGLIPLVGGQLVLTQANIATINTIIDAATNSGTILCKLSGNGYALIGTGGRSATDFIFSKDVSAIEGLSSGLSIVFTLASSLDAGVTSLLRSDSRIVTWVDPNDSYADNYVYGGALSQCTTFPNPAFNTLSGPVMNSGLSTFASEADPDAPGRKRFANYIKRPEMAVWAPSYVAAGALDPTWRSEIAIGDSAHALQRGTRYILGFSAKFGADVLAGSSAISIFDIHSPDNSKNIGPGPVSLILSGSTLALYHAYNTTDNGWSASWKGSGGVNNGYTYVTKNITVNSTDRWYFVMEICYSWDMAESPTLKLWTAQGPSGALVSQWSRTDIPLGYRESILDQFMKPKSGIYLFYDFADGTNSRSLSGKGIYMMTKTAGTPTADENTMLAHLRTR